MSCCGACPSSPAGGRWNRRPLSVPVPIWKMVGPSVILAGLALGSGEYVLWPFITFRCGFVFFWACILAVVMQYFLNMEIMRWTLATGESAVAVHLEEDADRRPDPAPSAGTSAGEAHLEVARDFRIVNGTR